MNRRIRGAASVGVIWVIVLLALVLFAGAGIYVLASEKTKNERAVKDAVLAQQQTQTRYEDAAKKVRELSDIVGFRDENEALSESRASEAKLRVTSLQEGNSWIGKDASTLSRVIERLETKVNDLTRDVTEAKAQTATAEAARADLDRNLRDMTGKKDEDVAKVQKDLQTERDRNAARSSPTRRGSMS